VSGFGNPDGITVMRAATLPPPIVRAFPKFPSDLASSMISGAVVVAYVIDTTGHVELESTSFLNATHHEFANAVCDYLPKVRYQPFLLGEKKVRILVVQLHEFIAPGSPDSPDISAAVRLQSTNEDKFTKTSIGTIVGELKQLPHCASR
jgi:hypothetical protein